VVDGGSSCNNYCCSGNGSSGSSSSGSSSSSSSSSRTSIDLSKIFGGTKILGEREVITDESIGVLQLLGTCPGCSTRSLHL